MGMMLPPSPGRVIFREGLIFGVILGVAYVALLLLGQLLAQSGLGVLFSLLNILLWLGMFFWAGARGAKQTGRVGTGSLTGLVAAVFAGIIAFVGFLAIEAPTLSQQISDTYSRQGASGPTPGAILIGIVIGVIILWLLGIGTGAGMGALGGLLGRSQSTVIPPTYPADPGYGYGQPPVQPPSPYPPPYQDQPPQWPQQ